MGPKPNRGYASGTVSELGLNGIVAELVDAISRMGRETEHSVILHLKGREFLMHVRILPIPLIKNT